MIAKSKFSPKACVLMVTLLLAIRLFLFVNANAVNILFWDQWDFYDGLFNHQGWLDLFRWQHGPHRQGLGYLVIRVVDHLSHWNMRVESFLAAAFFLASCLVALLMKYRLFKRFHYSDVIIPLIFLKLSMWEALVDTVNLSHGAIPIFLVSLFGLTLTTKPSWKTLASLLVLDFFSIFTGFGIFLGCVCPVVLAYQASALRTKEKSLAVAYGLAVLVSVAFFGLFFIGYKHQPAADCFVFPDRHPYRYLLFIAVQLSTILGVYRGNLGAIVPGCFLIAGFLFLLWKSVQLRSVLQFSLLAYTAFFALNSAVGRSCLGLGAGAASRYIPFMMPAQLAAYFFFLGDKSIRFRRNLLVAFAAVLVLNEFVATPLQFRGLTQRFAKRREWVSCYLKKEDIAFCDQSTGNKVYPSAEATRLSWKLKFLKKNHLSLYAGSE